MASTYFLVNVFYFSRIPYVLSYLSSYSAELFYSKKKGASQLPKFSRM